MIAYEEGLHPCPVVPGAWEGRHHLHACNVPGLLRPLGQALSLLTPCGSPEEAPDGLISSAGEPEEAQRFRAPPGQGWQEAGLEPSSPSPAPRKGQVGEYLSAAVAEKPLLAAPAGPPRGAGRLAGQLCRE